MASYTLAVNTTPKQELKLGKALEEINRGRLSRKEPAFLDFQAHLQWALDQTIQNYLAQHDEFEALSVGKAFLASGDVEQEEVKKLLGLF